MNFSLKILKMLVAVKILFWDKNDIYTYSKFLYIKCILIVYLFYISRYNL
jgi:hypothetical protein